MMSFNNAGKVLAVCSALLLGCGYVAFRHFEQADRTPDPKGDSSTPTVLPSSKNPNRITVLPSPKSIDAVLLTPAREGLADDFVLPEIPAGGQSKDKDRILLPSSKIGAILTPEDAGAIERDDIDPSLEEEESAPAEEAPPP